jgi:hypothetical protein
LTSRCRRLVSDQFGDSLRQRKTRARPEKRKEKDFLFRRSEELVQGFAGELPEKLNRRSLADFSRFPAALYGYLVDRVTRRPPRSE